MKTEESQYRIPLGDGTVKVIKWADYIEHGLEKPELIWIEQEPLKIFPDCMRPKERETE